MPQLRMVFMYLLIILAPKFGEILMSAGDMINKNEKSQLWFQKYQSKTIVKQSLSTWYCDFFMFLPIKDHCTDLRKMSPQYQEFFIISANLRFYQQALIIPSGYNSMSLNDLFFKLHFLVISVLTTCL